MRDAFLMNPLLYKDVCVFCVFLQEKKDRNECISILQAKSLNELYKKKEPLQSRRSKKNRKSKNA